MIRVELVYVAQDGATFQLAMDLKQGTLVSEALEQSGIYSLHPETKELTPGIYAKKVPLDRVLKEGDRLEIYRPLTLDPKENRRLKAGIRNKS